MGNYFVAANNSVLCGGAVMNDAETISRDSWIEKNIIEYFGYMQAPEQAILRALLATAYEHGAKHARDEVITLLQTDRGKS